MATDLNKIMSLAPDELCEFSESLGAAIARDQIWRPAARPHSALDLLCIINEVHFKLDSVVRRIAAANSRFPGAEYRELYLLYHGFKEFSSYFDPLTILPADQLQVMLNSSRARELRNLIMTAVGPVEQISCLLLGYDLHNKGGDAETRMVEVIKYLSGLSAYRPSSAVDKETLIQIEAELSEGQVNHDSVVLIAGCGPLPISAAAYALFCRRVCMIDISLQAIGVAQSFFAHCPSWIRNKCDFICADALDFDYSIIDASHLLLAGMLPMKPALLRNLLNSHGRTAPLRCIIREPKASLMILFNYPIGEFAHCLGESAVRYSTKRGSWSDIILADLPRAL